MSALALAQRADVDRGLKAAADAPLKSVALQATATWNPFDGAAARLEAQLHPAKHLTAYAAGTYDRNGPGAELGARWSWEW